MCPKTRREHTVSYLENVEMEVASGIAGCFRLHDQDFWDQEVVQSFVAPWGTPGLTTETMVGWAIEGADKLTKRRQEIIERHEQL